MSVEIDKYKFNTLVGDVKEKDRAEYGSYLIKNLALQIEPEYGSGFSVRQLEICRQFYRTYPIANALRAQLNWTQYKKLMTIDDMDRREYHELEAVNNGRTGREFERQVDSLLYEKLYLPSADELVKEVDVVKAKITGKNQ